MTILQNVEVWWAKLDPKRPDPKFDKENPKWNVQIRTKDKAVKKEWEALGLKPKLVEDEEYGNYYRLNLQRGSVKADGTKGEAPKVVDAKNRAINPNTIGNGSIANIRLFMRDGVKDPDVKIAVLMALQFTKVKVYKAKPMEDFAEAGETEFEGEQEQGQDEEDEAF